MRKFLIFSIFFIISSVAGLNFAQAETITQTIPVKIEQPTPFSDFLNQIKETFFPQVLAESFSKTLGGNYGNIYCPRADSSWKTCNNIYKQLQSNIKICTFKESS